MAKKAAKKVVKKATKEVAVKKSPAKKSAAKKAPAKKSTFVKHVTHLKAGDAAPNFSGKDQNGNLISLNDFAGKTLVLYFYPKDDTSGCTAQSCSLRDEYQYLLKKDYAVVGVSKDDEKSHQKFIKKFNLPFPLIADVDHVMLKAFDVWGKKMFMGRIFDGILRTTFIIKDKKIIRVITDVDTEGHAKQVMEG
ncbi:MAG TPA: thioredoxin-dependent thiol peroxidase [Bacteroidia bacterium]|nr:thioredoxin-dependent thiol peroxidase [Bacteroidia bacterium]